MVFVVVRANRAIIRRQPTRVRLDGSRQSPPKSVNTRPIGWYFDGIKLTEVVRKYASSTTYRRNVSPLLGTSKFYNKIK